ncbi:hypothetical protein OG275_38235 (plasmid) [Streptomyces niveus]|uniref:hypothetical protein n=1 Tax=Streptomyces niveus TaxID=193462 RepID=UPI002E34280E|nr:hypothetical protein [Streptomyces niveus]
MSDDVTGAQRAAWATIALDAYTTEAPEHLLPLPAAPERVRLGVAAAEAMARATRYNPADRAVTDTASAYETIGDLVAYVFHLGDHHQVTPDQLIRAADEMRSPYPKSLDAVCLAAAAADVDRVAAMLAALIEAAESFGCDVPALVADAREQHAEANAEEEETRQMTA